MCPVKFPVILHGLPFSTSIFTTAPCPDVPGPVERLLLPPSFLLMLDWDMLNPLTSQSFKVLSQLPLTRPFPSGVNATLYTLPLCPRSRSTRAPVATSHIWTTPLCREPAAMNWPLGDMDTELTPASLLSETLTQSTGYHTAKDRNKQPTLAAASALSMSHILTVLSPDPDMTRRPSREKSNE